MLSTAPGGEALRRYGTTELLSVTDITDFVAEQRAHIHGELGSRRVPAAGETAVGLDEIL